MVMSEEMQTASADDSSEERGSDNERGKQLEGNEWLREEFLIMEDL